MHYIAAREPYDEELMASTCPTNGYLSC